ncbi:hypothetical protein B0T21DRAFT_351681 [Apiosordaria backusii]|uniref:Peptidase A1 domain-containing protein n=1 Tax=Apiosordaria backusii TaxID=314023 RepID=A0AA40AN41_9PEZI|nr:hypothetical protein B0T21DRAFT_351681 [Apiosordaria backusii]
MLHSPLLQSLLVLPVWPPVPHSNGLPPGAGQTQYIPRDSATVKPSKSYQKILKNAKSVPTGDRFGRGDLIMRVWGVYWRDILRLPSSDMSSDKEVVILEDIPISVAYPNYTGIYRESGLPNQAGSSTGPGNWGDNGGAIGLGGGSQFLEGLYKKGYTQSKVFGVSFGGPGNDGNLVLDGVDLGKFSGPLELIPSVVASPGRDNWGLGSYEGYRVWLEFIEFSDGMPTANVTPTMGSHTPTPNARKPMMNNQTPTPDNRTPVRDVNTPPSSQIRPANTHRYNASRIPVGLETFNSLTYLPSHLFEAMWANLTQLWPSFSQHRDRESTPRGRVPCKWLDEPYSKAKFTFGFKVDDSDDMIRLEVPVTNLIYVWSSRLESPRVNHCHLGVVEEDVGDASLGTEVLKAGYWVFDAETRKVRVAKGEDCGSKVERWGKGKERKVGGCGGGGGWGM